MNRNSFIILLLILSMAISTYSPFQTKTAYASDLLSYVILSEYTKDLSIKDEFYLIAITSSAKRATFKSDNSRIASVNTYGKVTAKKAGRATITAKIKHAEASCNVYVEKTKIKLNASSASIERNETYQINATTSNGSPLVYKCNKKSVAQVDENGCILGIKPGEAIITVSADGSKKMFHLIVKEPTIRLSKSFLSLYRGETYQLSASVSSHVAPTWKSNRSKIALIDNSGTITALKHGTAIVTAKVNGTKQICEVVVKSPTIKLTTSELSLKIGETYYLSATVSSGNPVTFTSSNSSVASVDENGTITSFKKGTAYIRATEDGTKVKCKVTVTK
ncbi:MAG: Ig-like domain-containing protein [Velocimicrobium sp.]